MPEQRDDDGRLQGVLDEIIRLEEERSDIAGDLKGVESRLSVLKDTAAREISDRMAGLGDPSVTHGGSAGGHGGWHCIRECRGDRGFRRSRDPCRNHRNRSGNRRCGRCGSGRRGLCGRPTG